ncbi:ATP-grasp domain-containing protein [Pararhizobium sp. BT-229]|uniref:ATP-grasp domain-containing protein n=1 Tax=Pararhizobium sp. BT-229 TaxID=2986923 RepID=UPI0021F7AD89|nr:ATP-grasp domain-containing protein [Pararhizobium sp. BT-229]MCV9964252.1 ATP-grasp domain-containing protein [Pararhizobium sp. BT-229]
MQWILQDDKDNSALAEILDRMGIAYSVHTKLREVAVPELIIDDPDRVVVFGYYSAKAFVRERGYKPGVFELRPYVMEQAWQPFLLNPRNAATFIKVRDIADCVPDDGRQYFVRPVEDSKTMSGAVLSGTEIRAKAAAVMELAPERLVSGKLEPDTELLLSVPVIIQKEWRVWVVSGVVVTWSLYKMAGKMVVRPEIDQDALDFVRAMVEINPGYSDAYVIDVCRTEEGLRIIETNCINASGFYEADLQRLIVAIEDLEPAVAQPCA